MKVTLFNNESNSEQRELFKVNKLKKESNQRTRLIVRQDCRKVIKTKNENQLDLVTHTPSTAKKAALKRTIKFEKWETL